jgi:serine-type D-Ala-D-Ala carboxypeptidase (penicillin-binding protein 5/6)
MSYSTPARTTTGRTSGMLVAGLVVVIATIVAALGYQLSAPSPSTAASTGDVLRGEHRSALDEAVPSSVWPAYGQAAVQIGESQVHAGPHQHAAAIASVAKVMTAYVVLHDHPLRVGEGGPTITLTDDDVADTDRRSGQRESVVPVAAGEHLTELQALQALLLPSANNIAAVLARWDAGSSGRFVARMNAVARSVAMTHTRYTDPSGYDDATVSTAADQVRIVDRAMRLPAFESIVATPTAWLPVAGTVRNTNRLLGHDGFVGVKTGNTGAAGGCFAFRAIRWIHGKRTTITGVVLGQPDYAQVAAGLAAADTMVNRIAGRPGTSPPPAPGALPRTSARQRTSLDANQHTRERP